MDVGKLQEKSTKKAQVEAHKDTFSRQGPRATHTMTRRG